jgi:hypothetical protein
MRQFVNATVILIVSAAVIGILVSGVASVRDAANRAKCMNQVKQIGLAVHNYASTYQDKLPAAAFENNQLPVEKRLSWLFTIVPYMESDTLYSDTDKSAAWDSPQNLAVLQIRHHAFRCPAHPLPAMADSHYVGITGLGADSAFLPLDNPRAGILGYDRHPALADLKDLGGTLLLTETSIDNGPWAAAGCPTLRAVDPNGPGYLTRGGQFRSGHRGIAAIACFANGSVQGLDQNIDPRVFEAFATIKARD